MDGITKSGLTRRDFLKRLGFGAAAATTACVLPGGAALASETGSEPTWGMLIDLSRCSGCNSCALACQKENNPQIAEIAPKALAPDAYTFVQAFQATDRQNQVVTRYVKRQCMHCLDAACVSACPAAAMYNSGEGPVIYRANRCLGCRYCEVACPFGIPRFNWDNSITPKINKCWMCWSRLKAGERPACVDACPTGAVQFGRRQDLLAQAHARIATRPDLYMDHVYGEAEVGGTSVLYISDVPFENLGFVNNLPVIAPPEQTAKILYKLPYVVGGMAALMTGSALYTHRKPTVAVPAEVKPAGPQDGKEA